MVDFIRHYQFYKSTTNEWVEQAAKKIESSSSPWSTYYGTYGRISNSWGLNPDNPYINPKRPIHSHNTTTAPYYRSNFGCDECEILSALSRCPSGEIKEVLMGYFTAHADSAYCECPPGTFQNPICCFNCGILGDDGDGCLHIIGNGCNWSASNPLELICAATVDYSLGDGTDFCSLNACTVPAACQGSHMCCGSHGGCDETPLDCEHDPVCVDGVTLCTNIGIAEHGWFCGECPGENEDIWIDGFHNVVDEDWPNAENLGKCVCNDFSDPECRLINCPCPGEPCKLQLEGTECDTDCCLAGEEDCEPCPDGSWVPVGVPCDDDGGGGDPPPDPPPPPPPEECIDGTDPACEYCECTQTYQPIWWPCVGPYCTDEPCDPSDYDCYGGTPVVCYNYNTNDPIYYNASSLGPSVVIEYSTTEQACGGTYSYANAALLCEIADQFQLCVYIEDSNGVQTQISYDGDSPYGANSFRIDEAGATITLSSGTCVPANGKIVMKRCTDDQKMLLHFTEGSKLSASDLNASLHQLLFLIQEKEFASNNYFQLANTASLPGTAYYEVGEDTTAANLNGATVQFVSTDGTAKTYKFFTDGTATGYAPPSGNPVAVNLQSASTPALIAAELKAAIETSNGHGDKIVVTAYGLNTRKYILKQKTTGPSGNTTITESLTGVDPDYLIVPQTFVGGASTSDTAMIQFAPATTLPVSFNFAGASVGQLMIWDGQEISATDVPPLLTLSNIPDVEVSSLQTNQILKWNGSKWTNQTDSSGGSGSIDLTAFLRYDQTGNEKMSQFWSTTGGGSSSDTIYTAITESWGRDYLKNYISEAIDGSSNADTEKTTIPNAITAYGLGYLASMEWFKDDVINTTGLPTGFRNLTSGVMDAWWAAKTGSDDTGTSPAGIHASFTWELSRGMGRRYTSLTEAQTGLVTTPYPEVGQQGKPFHDIGDIRKCDTTGTTSTRAFSETLTIGSGTTGVSRVKTNNIKSLTLSPSKSFTSGIGKTKYNSGSTTILSGIPSHDYYLDAVKEVLSMSLLNNEGVGLTHPLDLTSKDTYPDYSDGIKELIKADYVYSQIDSTADNNNATAGASYNQKATSSLDEWYEEQINMPAVVTYYLGTIYDAASMTHTSTPSFPKALEWKGNYANIFRRNLHADANSDEWYSASSYLGTVGTVSNSRNGGDNYFHKWLVRVQKADWDETGTGEGFWKAFNPFDYSHYAEPGGGATNEHYLIPGGNEDTDNATNIAEYNAGYSYLLEANRTFSWLQTVMPTMYDEYVWEVEFVDNSSDINYHVVVDVSKHIDGCTELGPVFGTDDSGKPKRKGKTDCLSIGGSSGSSTNWGEDGSTHKPSYHLYPSDFYPEFVSVWNQVETDKIIASTRNHRVDGFDLVVRVPRMSRIAVVDRYHQADSDGASEDLHGPLALEYMDDAYTASTISSGTAADPKPDSLAISESNSNTESSKLAPDSIASVSSETGIQFIRMGIPANIRIDFTVVERGNMTRIPIVS